MVSYGFFKITSLAELAYMIIVPSCLEMQIAESLASGAILSPFTLRLNRDTRFKSVDLSVR